MTLVQSSNPKIVVDHTQTFQPFYGCGASWTDTSAWILNGDRANPSTDPRTLSDSERDEIIQALFSKSGDGIGLDVLRQPMGTSDFRWWDYTYEDVRGSFSTASDNSYIIPTILQTLQENPNVKVLALPWSAPAWAKENNSLNGGGLKSNDNAVLQDYHDYFVDFVDAYTAEGIPIWAISVQNEPQHESWDYPTMTLSPAEHGDLIQGVRAALDAAQHDAIKVVGYDHNWDTPDYVRDTLNGNAAARNAVSAIAFHCYGGGVEAQSQIKAEFPEVEIWFTECTEHGESSSFNGDFRWALRELVIGTTKHWASTVLEWNLVLMEGGGPKIPGGCENCRGLIDVQYDGGYRKNPAYYALGHLSKFVQSDAVEATKRIASTEPTSNTKTMAMLNPDGSSFVIILNDGYPDVTLDLDWMSAICTVTVPSWSAVTVFRPSGSTTMQVWRTTDQQSQTRLTFTENVNCVSNGPSPTATPTGAPVPVPVTPSPVETPSASPTKAPTDAPTTSSPTTAPTDAPTFAPSEAPTKSPTATPTAAPTKAPASSPPPPTSSPTKFPVEPPTSSPTKSPVEPPTASPTTTPATSAPTEAEDDSSSPPPCCTNDFRICVTGWCGESQGNCQSCNGFWGALDDTCLPFWSACTHEVDPNCCGGAECKGNKWHKSCVPP